MYIGTDYGEDVRADGGGLEHRRRYSSRNGARGTRAVLGRIGGYAAGLGMFEPTRGIGRIEEGRGGFCI